MDNISRGVAIAVAAVWAVIAVLAQLTHDNSTLIEVTPIMLIVVGFLFGIKIIRPSKDDKKERKDDS